VSPFMMGGRGGHASVLSGNVVFIFGGKGCDSVNSINKGFLSDIWRFDLITNTYTYLAGSTTYNAKSVYTTPGVTIGGRQFHTMAIGGSAVYIFGGFGYDSTGIVNLNDLFSVDISTFTVTFLQGSTTGNKNGNYTTPSGFPGSRQGHTMSYISSTQSLLVFGGNGYDFNSPSPGLLNDLWQYDISGKIWTFLTQNKSSGVKSTYATPGVIGGRDSHAMALQPSTNTLYVVGGTGYDASGNIGNLNDVLSISNLVKICGAGFYGSSCTQCVNCLNGGNCLDGFFTTGACNCTGGYNGTFL